MYTHHPFDIQAFFIKEYKFLVNCMVSLNQTLQEQT